jgi:hypothetical protein
MITTSSLFIGFGHMSNDWKVENVSYKFGMGSFLSLYLDWTQLSDWSNLISTEISAARLISK